MTVGASHINDRVARFYRLPSGRWHGEVIGPGGAFCAYYSPSYEAVMSFLARRMRLPAGAGVCPNGCTPTVIADQPATCRRCARHIRRHPESV